MEQLHQSHKGANQQNIDFGAARPALAATVRAQPQPHGAANCSARQRPSTAPPRAATSKPAEPSTQHPGKHSRYGVTEILTREGMYSPTPKVLRDLDDRRGFANRSPTEFLRRNEGGTLRERRQRLAALQADPPGRDPAFVKGSGSVNFSWGSAPPASAGTMFRKLRDIGTINFVMVRTGAVQNFVMWAKEARAGSWESKWSEDVPSTIADEADKWLPLFLDGIRELQVGLVVGRGCAVRAPSTLATEGRAADGLLHARRPPCTPPVLIAPAARLLLQGRTSRQTAARTCLSSLPEPPLTAAMSRAPSRTKRRRPTLRSPTASWRSGDPRRSSPPAPTACTRSPTCWSRR